MRTATRPLIGTSSRTNSFAIAGLVLSIIGIFLFSIILGPLGIIFGGVGWSRANRGAGGRGMSVAAVIIGVIDILLFIGLIAIASHTHNFRWHI